MSKHTQIRASVRRKKVANAAAISRKLTVKNCTITNIVKVQTNEDNPNGFNPNIKPNGNGPISKEFIEMYHAVRDARIKYLKEHYSGKKHYKRKQPWYMLTKGKQFNYESKPETYGMRTDYFPVPSETKILNEKNTPKKLSQEERWENIVAAKLSKWEKKNPRPIKKGDNDLFESQFIPQWEKARQEAEEHIRDVVVSMYHKLKVVGNKIDYSKGKIKPIVIGYIKDSDMEGHHVTYPELKNTDNLYKNALKIAQNAMNKDSAIVDADLLNHKETEKRPLIEAKRAIREAA